jgi:ATP-dependent exoDNAse (exonuclease V) alpha subunit
VTRAKRHVIIIGDTAVLSRMVANNRSQRRLSGLKEKLKAMSGMADARP